MEIENRNIAIVVVTYNRVNSLKRLLESVSNADYLNLRSVDLIISCDFSGSHDCEIVANDFRWIHGNKRVVAHSENLGLRNHVLISGDLVEDYDGIIMLEDDLWVAPNFYRYIIEADLFFKDDKTIGQISLYTNQYDEYSSSKVVPLHLGGDNFFMQVPSSWGQYWTKEQWFNFKKDYQAGDLIIDEFSVLPSNVIENWPESSWKKYFYHYLIKNELFVVYPYQSLSTNFGDEGTHYSEKATFLQAPIDVRTTGYSFKPLSSSHSVYDYLHELHPKVYHDLLPNEFKNLDLEFDLNGSKELSKIKSEYLVSAKKCSDPIFLFASDLLPQELNIIYKIQGDFYALGKTIDFEKNSSIEKVVTRNENFIPSLLRFRINRKARETYANSRSYKLGNRIIGIMNKLRFK